MESVRNSVKNLLHNYFIKCHVKLPVTEPQKLRERGHLGRPRRRWEDNIRVDNQEIVWEGVCWIELDEDTDGWRNAVNTLMNLGVS